MQYEQQWKCIKTVNGERKHYARYYMDDDKAKIKNAICDKHTDSTMCK